MVIAINEGKHPRNYWAETDKPEEFFVDTVRQLFELWAAGADGPPFEGAPWANALLANAGFSEMMQKNGKRHAEEILSVITTSTRPLEQLMVLIDKLPRIDAFTIMNLISLVGPEIVEAARGAIEKSTLSERGKKGADARYAKDPKQSAKSFIHECWDGWQKNPDRYKKQSDFVSDVLTKIDVNESGSPIVSFDTVLKKWIPEFTAAKKAKFKK